MFLGFSALPVVYPGNWVLRLFHGSTGMQKAVLPGGIFALRNGGMQGTGIRGTPA